MFKRKSSTQKGFTLIEILVVIGIIAILAAVVLIAINPARQFAQARDSQRVSNVNAILNAIGQNMADNTGLFDCGGVNLPAVATPMSDSGYDIRDCIVPDYMSEIPIDPDPAIGNLVDSSDYNTGYSVVQDAVTGRITVSAAGEVPAGSIIEVTR